MFAVSDGSKTETTGPGLGSFRGCHREAMSRYGLCPIAAGRSLRNAGISNAVTDETAPAAFSMLIDYVGRNGP
jgi:hypothetical protein